MNCSADISIVPEIEEHEDDLKREKLVIIWYIFHHWIISSGTRSRLSPLRWAGNEDCIAMKIVEVFAEIIIKL